MWSIDFTGYTAHTIAESCPSLWPHLYPTKTMVGWATCMIFYDSKFKNSIEQIAVDHTDYVF